MDASTFHAPSCGRAGKTAVTRAAGAAWIVLGASVGTEIVGGVDTVDAVGAGTLGVGSVDAADAVPDGMAVLEGMAVLDVVAGSDPAAECDDEPQPAAMSIATIVSAGITDPRCLRELSDVRLNTLRA